MCNIPAGSPKTVQGRRLMMGELRGGIIGRDSDMYNEPACPAKAARARPPPFAFDDEYDHRRKNILQVKLY